MAFKRTIKLFGKKKNSRCYCIDCFLGGDNRDRTADLLNAIQALSQLSYTPICSLGTGTIISNNSANVNPFLEKSLKI